MAPPPSKCPRCSAPVTTLPDESGHVTCGRCGAQLRARPHPSATLPPGTPLKNIPRPAEPAERPAQPAAPAAEPAARSAEPAVTPPLLEAILAELKVLRRQQEEVLGYLRGRRPAAEREEAADEEAPAPPAMRSRRRKSVLLIDDDAATRGAAAQALERAEVPVRSAGDGRAGLAAIAEDKPDVIVLELELAGPMAGKDVINMIKATMEWVDVPIVLYTRASVESQREARIVHGADEYLPKAAGPEALLSKVIQVFRRG